MTRHGIDGAFPPFCARKSMLCFFHSSFIDGAMAATAEAISACPLDRTTIWA